MQKKYLVGLSLTALLSLGISPAVASGPEVIDNTAIRFGNGTESSVDSYGLLKQPFYYSAADDRYYKLTYSTYPLDLAIGIGTGNTSHWDGNDVYELSNGGNDPDSLTVDYSGLTPLESGSSRGYGEVTSVVTHTLGSSNQYTIKITNVYTLGQTDNFVQIDTTVENLSGVAIDNVNIWVGTRDDYVGTSDRPTKTRGEIVNGAFQQISAASDPSDAIQITSGSEGVLFYSTTDGTSTIVDSCCSFENVYDQDPSLVAPVTGPADGSYGVVLPVGNLADDASSSLTWFYAAGSLADLADVTESVANAAASTTISDKATDGAEFTYRFSEDADLYYVVVPEGSTAPDANQIKAGVDYSGVTLTDAGSAAVTADVERVIDLTNLQIAGGYEIYFVAEYFDTATSQTIFSEVDSLTFYALPGGVTVNRVLPGDGKVKVEISAATSADTFRYSIDGGSSWISRSPYSTDSPWIIEGLTNDVELEMVFSAELDGDGGATSSTFRVTPRATPTGSIQLSNITENSVTVDFSFSADGDIYYVVVPDGSAVPSKAEVAAGVDYGDVTALYSDQYNESGTVVRAFDLSGLQQGTIYDLHYYADYFDAFNDASASSAVQKLEIATLPNDFNSISVSPGDGEAVITYSIDGEIDELEYSTDGGLNWLSGGSSSGSSPWSLSLSNDTTYDLLFRPVLLAIPGNASESFEVTPSSLPYAPVISSFKAGTDTIDLSIESPEFDGGQPITNYEYSIDAGANWIAFDPATTATSLKITDLEADTEYQVQLRAITDNGAGESTPMELISTRSGFLSAPSPFQGPVISGALFGARPISAGTNGTITGSNLQNVVKVIVNGQELDFTSTATGISIQVPNGFEPGKYDLVVQTSSMRITVQDAIEVIPGVATPIPGSDNEPTMEQIEQAIEACESEESSFWAKKVAPAVVNFYAKCPEPGVTYSVLQQTDAEGDYLPVISDFIEDLYDRAQLFDPEGRYVFASATISSSDRFQLLVDGEVTRRYRYSVD